MQDIEFYVVTNERVQYAELDSWEPNSEGRFFWIQKIADWILRRYGKNPTREKMEPRRVQISKTDIIDAIVKQYESRLLTGSVPRKIYVGHDYHRALLLQDPRIHDTLSFYIGPNIDCAPQRKLFDCELIFTSHIDGIFVASW